MIILWIAFSLLVGALGRSRTCGFTIALLVSLIFSPIVGLVVALLCKRKKSKVELLAEAKMFLDSGVVTPLEYSKMTEDIMCSGKLKDVSRYRNSAPGNGPTIINPFRH